MHCCEKKKNESSDSADFKEQLNEHLGPVPVPCKWCPLSFVPLVTSLWVLLFCQFFVRFYSPPVVHLFLQPDGKASMGKHVEALAKAKVHNTGCSPFWLPSQSYHHRRQSGWLGTICL